MKLLDLYKVCYEKWAEIYRILKGECQIEGLQKAEDKAFYSCVFCDDARNNSSGRFLKCNFCKIDSDICSGAGSGGLIGIFEVDGDYDKFLYNVKLMVEALSDKIKEISNQPKISRNISKSSTNRILTN